VAIVTGGGTDMGKAIVTLLAAADAHVVVHASRSEAAAIATAQESGTHHGQALPFQAAVAAAAAVASLVEQRERQLGRLDVLVYNAGDTNVAADTWLVSINASISAPLQPGRPAYTVPMCAGCWRAVSITLAALALITAVTPPD
jgi:NAD(P)-dependent dehydrogenase (short-subunit alcohol dehydrogenase family)